MRRYDDRELRAFLASVDANLTGTARITIIGGSAVVLAFAVDIRTGDIDTFQSMTNQLVAAVGLARGTTGFSIPVGDASIADLPYNFEDRVEEVLLGLPRLRVWAPEANDLAISKSLRGNDHDLEQLRALRDANRLDADILICRFRDEMSHAIGDHRRIKADFIYVIDDLFGALARSEAEKQLEGWEKR